MLSHNTSCHHGWRTFLDSVRTTFVNILLVLAAGCVGDDEQPTPPTEPTEPTQPTQPDAKGCAGADAASVLQANNICDDTASDYEPVNDGTIAACEAGPHYGLRWQKQVGNEMNFQEAERYCANLTLQSRRWRLPCMAEFYGTYQVQIDANLPNSTLPGVPRGAAFWTATKNPSKPGTAQTLVFAVVPLADGTPLNVNAEALVRCISGEAF